MRLLDHNWYVNIGVAAGFIILAGILYQMSQYWYRSKQATAVEEVCIDFYSRNTNKEFTVEPSYDSDGDGYGSCAVFVDGVVVQSLECSADLWFNPEKCRVAKKVLD